MENRALMGFISSHEGSASSLDSFDSHLYELDQTSSYSSTKSSSPSITVIVPGNLEGQAAVITTPPELRLRVAVPEPQDVAGCQQASQSASQAIQQASQQASNYIRQASEQASQSAAAASRSATDAIRQAQQSASQSIAVASRSASSALSSASSVVSSIQSSAADAISRANAGQSSAQASASVAQVEASKAVLQAGAAVAAATGKAAAAGSSFLAAAAQATESAQASVSAFGAAAESQISQASKQVTASQTTAITATQTAIAIVGSIIASALITILIYFLIARHRKKAKRKSRGQNSPGKLDTEYHNNPKAPSAAQSENETTKSESKAPHTETRTLDPIQARPSSSSLSLFPRSRPGDNPLGMRNSGIKTTSVPWNPSNPPKPPTLGSWLKTRDISPFGPINLPTDDNFNAPLGGQLKSPLQTLSQKPKSTLGPRLGSTVPVRSPKIPILNYRTGPGPTAADLTRSRSDSIKRKAANPETSEPEILHLNKDTDLPSSYRQSKASVWTDDIPNSSPSPWIPSRSRSTQKEPPTAIGSYTMGLPSPKKPIRTTAEWLSDMHALPRDSTQSQQPEDRNSPPSFTTGLPKTPKPKMEYGTLGQGKVIQLANAKRGQVVDVGGVNRFREPGGQDRGLSRYSGDRSLMSTPGVGKAL